MMLSMRLAWAQTLNLWRAGALRVLVFSLVIAITAITSVGFFTSRVESALNQQGGLLLGGDMVILSDHSIPALFETKAAKQHINTVKTYEFASMVVFKSTSQLVEIKAVSQGFPLRGDLTIGQTTLEDGQHVVAVPKKGEVWLEPRLANLLNAKVGEEIKVGALIFRVSAILLREPSRGGDMFSFAPRLMMNAADLPATQLIQYGSRVKYQLLLAANPQVMAAYFNEAKPLLARGEKIEDVRNARPEIKSALDKAQQFLGLSAMISVILAMVAMVLASLPYIKQSLDMFALMRCFGASKQLVLQVLTIQTMLIALFSAAVGVMVGFVAQFGLEKLAGHLFVENLPPINLAPVGLAFALSVAMMFAVVLPHAWQMRHLTAMNILRRETLDSTVASQFKFLPAIFVMVMAIWWQANNIKLAIATVLTLISLGIIMVALAFLFIKSSAFYLEKVASNQVINSMHIGLRGLKRRFGLSVMQMLGFSMGLTVLMLLALVRNDLIQNWQASLPADAPNRFVINIQAQQIPDMQTFFKAQDIHQTNIFPMVRGRLISKNDEPMQQKTWDDERAKRLAEREFNLSMAATMQSDNQLVAGRWWRADEQGKPYLSIEQDLAKSLGIKLGDVLVFDVAGTPLKLQVTSIRKVDWDTMRANFFAVTPPRVLDEFSASYISSFHLPSNAEQAMNQLIKQLPNLTVIDIAALLQQVRGIMQQMSTAIEYVFVFSLIAGVAVLYAAMIATQETRVMEATLMRVFGSTKRDVSIAYVTEFACIGFVAALVATVASHLLAYYLSSYILNIPFKFNVVLACISMLSAMIFIPCAAWFGLRRYLNISPRQLLQSI
jgi:putative ABC transport system permease protein